MRLKGGNRAKVSWLIFLISYISTYACEDTKYPQFGLIRESGMAPVRNVHELNNLQPSTFKFSLINLNYPHKLAPGKSSARHWHAGADIITSSYIYKDVGGPRVRLQGCSCQRFSVQNCRKPKGRKRKENSED